MRAWHHPSLQEVPCFRLTPPRGQGLLGSPVPSLLTHVALTENNPVSFSSHELLPSAVFLVSCGLTGAGSCLGPLASDQLLAAGNRLSWARPLTWHSPCATPVHAPTGLLAVYGHMAGLDQGWDWDPLSLAPGHCSLLRPSLFPYLCLCAIPKVVVHHGTLKIYREEQKKLRIAGDLIN